MKPKADTGCPPFNFRPDNFEVINFGLQHRLVTGSDLMNGFEKAMYMLPQNIRQAAECFAERDTEEIRLRYGRKPTALCGGKEFELDCGELKKSDIEKILERITGASLHTAAAAMQEGYINCMGLRVGICGKAVIHNDELKGFKDFSSLSIRIPRECRGVCDLLLEEIYMRGFKNTLLISRPGGGKTTALREIIRKLSDSGLRIGVVDERNELSASDELGFQFELGSHSDVLVNVPKAQGALMLLKGMNPEIIAMDEISSATDIAAVSQVYGCGVGILASAHAADRDELYRRPLYNKLVELGVFKYIVTIKNTAGGRVYAAERL